LKKIQLAINKAAVGFIHSRIRLTKVEDGYHMLTASALPPEVIAMLSQVVKKNYGMKLSHMEPEAVKKIVPQWQTSKPSVLKRTRAANRGMLYKLTKATKASS
jgi:hypothetical protein